MHSRFEADEPEEELQDASNLLELTSPSVDIVPAQAPDRTWTGGESSFTTVSREYNVYH